MQGCLGAERGGRSRADLVRVDFDMIAATKRLMLQFSGMLLRHGYVWNVFDNRKVDTGDADVFPYESAYAARLSDRLYCSGLIPPSDSLIRRSLYQWM